MLTKTIEAAALVEVLGDQGYWVVVEALKERAESLKEAKANLEAIGAKSLKIENELNATLEVLEKLGTE